MMSWNGMEGKIHRIRRSDILHRWSFDLERYMSCITPIKRGKEEENYSQLLASSYSGHIFRYCIRTGKILPNKSAFTPNRVVRYQNEEDDYLIGLHNRGNFSFVSFFDVSGETPVHLERDVTNGRIRSSRYRNRFDQCRMSQNPIDIFVMKDEGIVLFCGGSGSLVSLELSTLNKQPNEQRMNFRKVIQLRSRGRDYTAYHLLKSTSNMLVVAYSGTKVEEVNRLMTLRIDEREGFPFTKSVEHPITKIESFVSDKSGQPQEYIISGSEHGPGLHLWNLEGHLLKVFHLVCFDLYVGNSFVLVGSNDGSVHSVDEEGINLVRSDFKNRSRISFFEYNENSFGVFSMDEAKVMIFEANIGKIVGAIIDKKERIEFTMDQWDDFEENCQMMNANENVEASSMFRISFLDSMYKMCNICCNKSFLME